MLVSEASARFGEFCEGLLTQCLGAETATSYDFSHYEGATHLVDFGRPAVFDVQYDTVVDCGSLEHIFNVTQALKNLSDLCVVGGQILHVSPANNFCGHGFWQFSPELFFSLYSEHNGYGETEVFLANVAKTGFWYEVKKPANGERALLINGSPVYVLCRTRKLSSVSYDNVQQSDYLHRWQSPGPLNNRSKVVCSLKNATRSNPALYRLARAAYLSSIAAIQRVRRPPTLSDRNRHLSKHRVATLLASQSTAKTTF